LFDPKIGRWISEDPIGFQAADPNLYRYAGNDATNLTDPSGLAAPNVLVTRKIDKPVLGTYGAFMWPVQFKLDAATKNGGWIVQEVRITFKAFDSKNVDVTGKLFPKGANRHFWEAWEVPAGNKVPKVTFFPNDKSRDLYADYAKAFGARIIRASPGNPNFRRNVGIGNDIAGKKWDDISDLFFTDPTESLEKQVKDPKLYAWAQLEIVAKVFFVDNPKLYPGLKVGGDPGAGRNLSLAFDSKDAPGMKKWLNDNEKVTSPAVTRWVVVTWESKGKAIITNVSIGAP
jgi:hypothetical protein